MQIMISLLVIYKLFMVQSWTVFLHFFAGNILNNKFESYIFFLAIFCATRRHENWNHPLYSIPFILSILYRQSFLILPGQVTCRCHRKTHPPNWPSLLVHWHKPKTSCIVAIFQIYCLSKFRTEPNQVPRTGLLYKSKGKVARSDYWKKIKIKIKTE